MATNTQRVATAIPRTESKKSEHEQLRNVVNTTSLRLRGFRYKQNKTTFMVTVITGDQITQFAEVPRYNPLTKEGYQRDPDDARAKKAAQHLLAGGTFPGAAILSLRRDEMKDVLITQGEDRGHYQDVDVIIPGGTKLWLVDGQHRDRAVQLAKESDEGFHAETFGMSAVVMFSDSEMDEALTFKTIHEQQKSMPTDLTNRLLQREVEEGRANPSDLIETGQKAKYRDYVAVKVTEALAAHSDSPWKGKIRPVNPGQLPAPEEGGEESPDWPISETSLAASVKDFVRMMGIAPPEKTLAIVKTYWRAIVKQCGLAWEDPENHRYLRKTPGIYILNMILPTVYSIAREAGRADEDMYREILAAAEIDSSYFRNDGPLHGVGGVGNFKKLAERLEAKLFKSYGGV